MASTTEHDGRADGLPPSPPRGTTGRSGGAGPRRRGGAMGVFGVLGELLITAGVLLALFVVYSLWWTNVTANSEANRQSDQVRRGWSTDPGGASGSSRAFNSAHGIGFLHVPAMKNGSVLVKKGTDTEVLNQGVAGYYTDPVKSALPWAKHGNVTLAAHRDGHGAKFHNIHKVKVGDPVVLETKETWYVYKVYKILPSTSKYDLNVIRQIPKESGRTKPGRYLTLTTCTPMYTSNYRYVVWSQLVRTQKVDSDRTPPPELR